MRELHEQLTEDQMVQAFLEAEVMQERHAATYAEKLASLKGNAKMTIFLHDPDYAGKRLELLKQARGWPDKLLFKDFPSPVSWYESALETSDLQRVRYIDYSYWNELSKGTHSPLAAAKTIQDGATVYDQSNDAFWEIADLVRNGKSFGPIILLKTADEEYTIIEGHTRVTGFALAGRVPAQQRAIIAISDDESAIKWSKEEQA